MDFSFFSRFSLSNVVRKSPQNWRILPHVQAEKMHKILSCLWLCYVLFGTDSWGRLALRQFHCLRHLGFFFPTMLRSMASKSLENRHRAKLQRKSFAGDALQRGKPLWSIGSSSSHQSPHIPNAVVLNAVGRRKAQKSANERKRRKVCQRAQKGGHTKEPKRAPPR